MKKHIVLILILALAVTSCEDGWLEEKRDIKIVVPSTLEDIKLILHDDDKLAKDNINFAELSADDYYIPNDILPNVPFIDRNAYLWEDDIYGVATTINDWDQSYYQILTSNVSLDALSKIKRTNENEGEWRTLKGTALFVRAKAMYYLNQQFAGAYSPETANDVLSTPIKTTSEVNEKIVRSSLQENYEHIISDFSEAAELLPSEGEFITDPTKSAAYGYLARAYLVMGDYENAYKYADRCLEIHDQLMNFNDLNTDQIFIIPQYNVEVIQYSVMSSLKTTFSYLYSRIPNDIYNSYDDNDLRKLVYFRDRSAGENGTFGFRGSYSKNHILFSGIATDEMYLVRSECLARLGNIDEAMEDLNKLLETRWKTGTFIPLVADDSENALSMILFERRKELLRRGIRWTDLKRLNLESGRGTTLVRTVNGVTVSLPANDPKYVLPIPEYIIKYNGITQNPR
jgi:tetratricopeptide (TPR) repeat protein